MRCRPATRATPMLNSSSIRLRRRESVSLGRFQNCNLLEMDHFRRHGVEDELGRCVLTIRLVTPKRPTAAHDKLSTVPETRDPYQTSHTSLRVQCYAGRKADERPVRFQLGDDHHVVDEVVDQW